ncbi:hypothetical protein [Aestuariivirga sp.]|uniref:hypothetical protein n=1 Tax=Aestuariivirga sp. TaxID=2650926 RepID=UPI0039E66302
MATNQVPDAGWHDNHIHAFRIAEGQHGTGELILDIDHILEWRKADTGDFQFLLSPAILTFHEVSHLRMTIDFSTVSAALGPFCISSMSSKDEKREHYMAKFWTIELGWPQGEITFEATGFDFELMGEAVVSDHQNLPRVAK